MANYRRDRINDTVTQELNIALRDVGDPGVQENFVTITRSEVAPDLRNATIYFSCMQGDPKEVKRALVRCTGMLRHHLAMTVNLRITPTLTFIHDTSMEHGARIAELLYTIGTAEDGAPKDET